MKGNNGATHVKLLHHSVWHYCARVSSSLCDLPIFRDGFLYSCLEGFTSAVPLQAAGPGSINSNGKSEHEHRLWPILWFRNHQNKILESFCTSHIFSKHSDSEMAFFTETNQDFTTNVREQRLSCYYDCWSSRKASSVTVSAFIHAHNIHSTKQNKGVSPS